MEENKVWRQRSYILRYDLSFEASQTGFRSYVAAHDSNEVWSGRAIPDGLYEQIKCRSHFISGQSLWF